MKILLCVLVSAACVAGSAFGQQDNKAGTTAAQFLKIGVGARAVSMAEASVGVVEDPSAMYWNVSGLTGVRSIAVTATHTNWFADLTHQFVGIVLPVGDDHRFGLNATVLNLGEIETTTEEEPRGTGAFFKATDVAVGVSYAVRLVEFFSFGATVKYVTQSIANESASAIGVDLGTTLRTGYKGITIGMAFSNFGTGMKLDGRDLHRTYDPHPNNSANTGVSSYLGTESWDLPVMFRVGIGWELVGPGEALMQDDMHCVRLAADARHPNDAPENASVGVEYLWDRLFALRGGYHFNDDVRTWSAGAGVHWQSARTFTIGIDYAYASLDPLGPIHVFTLTLGF
jgi:hypothetical protein